MNYKISTDTITDFTQLTAKCCPSGFEFRIREDYIIIHRIDFHIETHFPSMEECIRIARNLHVQLQCNGNPIPLPQWFIHGNKAKLTKFRMSENYPIYIKNVVEEYPYSILNELQKRYYHIISTNPSARAGYDTRSIFKRSLINQKAEFYKPKSRPPFSEDLIRYALLLRYTSRQACKLHLGNFPLPYFSLLEKIQTGDMG